MADVFISYAREDKDFVRRLDEALKSRGREAWVDWEGIRPTEEFMQAIYGPIEAADSFVFVVTPDSVRSIVCGREIAHAAAHNKRMVPIVARDVNADIAPEPVAKLNWIFFRDTDDFEKAIDTLISALDTDLNWVHAHTRLLTRAIEWNANGKNDSFVLGGDDLRSAERWLAEAGAEKERQPTALQTEYIIASRKAASRRQRITLGAVTFGFIIAVVLAGLAFFAEAKAKKQTYVAIAATKKTSEIASRGSVSLARYSNERGKNAQALAQLAQALRLNSENREASELTAAMLMQLTWHFPLTSSLRHNDVVYSAQFSPDGKHVLTASWDNTAQLWDVRRGRPIGIPLKHENEVNSAQFSPDGKWIVTASADKTARVWDAASGNSTAEPMRHEGAIYSAQFSPDGRRIATGSADKTARLWDASSGKPIGEPMRHDGMVFSVQFSPEGHRVVTASADKTARLWDAASGQSIGEPMKHEDVVNSAQFSPDCQELVTASWDKTARLWDAITGKPIGEPMKHEDVVNSAQFSPDGQRVLTASEDKTARLWDAVNGESVGEPMKHEKEVNSAQFSPDGQQVLTASEDKTARLWEATDRKPLDEPMKHKDAVNSAQFSPDDQRIVTASDDKTARLWDATSGKPIGEPMKHEEAVNSAQFSPDSQRIVTASADKTARLWDTVSVTDRDTREDVLLLAELAEAMAGVTLQTVEGAENLRLLAPEQIIDLRQKIAAKFSGPPSKLTPLQRFMQWSVGDRTRRTISPLSQETVSEWLENRIKDGTVEGLRAAMQLDPANPRVTVYLGRCLADQALKESSDSGEAGALEEELTF